MSDITPIGEIKGLPLFMGSSPSTIQDLFEQGEDVFYVLGYEGVEVKEGTTTKKVSRTALYQVKKNLVGYSQLVVPDGPLGLNLELANKAVFLLPEIPWEMEQMMSNFFHKAYELHGTESILLLTYDETFLDSDTPELGWGLIAPPQENTAASCHYEIDETVMAMKGENESIVGSAHSHPDMKAYFSTTDHKDQAEWDGLHITYGWAKGKPDEHYIEMIQGGKQWPYDASDIFASPPKPALDTTEKVDQLLENVKKKAFSNTTSQNWQTPSGSGAGGSGIRDNYKSTALSKPNKKNRPMVLPKDAPSPDTSILIGVIPDDSMDTKAVVKCPLCNLALIKPAIGSGRCYGCRGFLAFTCETIEEFYQRYITANNIDSLPELNPAESTRPIHFIMKNGNVGTVSPDVRTDAAKK
jgi:hypothetical protein